MPMNNQLRGRPVSECDQRLKLFLFSKSGCGKSFFATQFPKAYYIDCEGRIKRQLYVDHLNKNGSVVWQTDSFDELLKEIKVLASCKHDYQTLVIDSITPIYTKTIAECRAKLLGNKPDNGQKIAFGLDYQKAKAKFKGLVDLLRQLDMNVVITAHSKDVWDDDSVSGTTFDAYDKFDYFSEVVMEAKLEKDEKDNTYKYKAIITKSTIGSLAPNMKIDFSYAVFKKLYEKELAHFTPKPVLLTEEQVPLQKSAQVHPIPQGPKVKEETRNHLKFLVAQCQIAQDVVNKWFAKAGVSKFDDFTEEQATRIIDKLEADSFEAKQAWVDFVKVRESYNQEQTEGVVAHA
jgi:hypothetical protein